MKQLLAATLCALLLSASAEADRVTYSSPPSSGGGTPVTFVGNTAGSANTYTLASPTPSGFTLTDQYVVCGSISASNTGASTLAVAGTTATAIKKQTPAGFAVLNGGELVLGNQYCLQYNAAGTAYVILNNLGGGVSQAATSTTVTSGQWANWQVFDIQAASQTLTLPVVTTLPTNGGILIKTRGNSVTLTPNAADGINGGTVGASVTVPANYMTAVTTSGTSGTTALSAPLGLVAGTNVTLTPSTNGTTTIAATGGGGGGTIINNSIGGCTLSNDGATPNTKLDISACTAADSTNAAVISAGAFTKTTGGAWASGTGNNGMGNGLTIATSTWYHVCAANNGGTADYYFDTSVSCANRPAGISDTKVRRIGSFLTDGSSNIVAFFQRGDVFVWKTPFTDANNQTYGTTATLVTLTVPPGLPMEARLHAYVSTQTAADNLLIYDPDASTTTSANGNTNCAVPASGSNIINGSCFDTVMTNSSSQVDVVAGQASSTGVYINTVSYRDFRGQ